MTSAFSVSLEDVEDVEDVEVAKLWRWRVMGGGIRFNKELREWRRHIQSLIGYDD